jgi:DNA-binding transcriptional LysR family regulator
MEMTPTMRQLDTRSAQIFLTIAQEGSIAKAAIREHMVPSAVSKRLQELEAAVGVPLVERSQKGIQLTPAGEAMAHHARVVVLALEALQAEMSDYANGVRGHVRVRVSASALAAGVPAQIQTFLEKHSDIKLELEEQETPIIVRDVVEGRADIGLGPNILVHEGLQLTPYGRYDLAVAVPENHALAGRPSLRYEETLAYDHVEQPQTSALSQLLDYAAKQASMIKKTRIHVRGFDAVCHMVGLGMGIGVVPSFLSKTYGPTYDLRFIPLTDTWAHPLICIMYRERATLPAPALALVEHLERNGSR